MALASTLPGTSRAGDARALPNNPVLQLSGGQSGFNRSGAAPRADDIYPRREGGAVATRVSQ
jgi:hypothetical protein